MRTLVVLPRPPAAQGGAADRCAIGLVLGLRAHGVSTTVIAPDATGAWPSDAEALGVQRVSIEHATGIGAKLAHLRRPLGDLSRTALSAAVRDAARDVDLVHLDTNLLAWVDDGVAVPSVASLHYRARLDRDPIAPWHADGRDLALTRMVERRIVRRHRWLVASSDVVADAIRADRPDADVTVVPLALDPGAYPSAPLDGARPAGMIGTMDWPPTRSALDRLFERVWPAVRAAVPSAELVLAGRGSAALGDRGRAMGVSVLGEVDDSQAFLRSLAVLVYPVTRGSGMKVKVLEAIASGVPVVTTPAGAEGLRRSDGVIVAEDDGTLASATASLLRDESERAERGAAARRLFMEQCAPTAATEPLVELYRRVLR